MQYQVGDPVMHWTYGFGRVVGLEERAIAGRSALYYAVSIRDMTVWVPVDESLESHLRPPTPRKGFRELFDILSGPGEPLPDDRQERRLALLERLKDGQAASFCRVLRDLSAFQHVHSLNDNDQSLMKRSHDALLDEWAFALDISVAKADGELHRMLWVEKIEEPKNGSS